jgi:hypothetical protein
MGRREEDEVPRLSPGAFEIVTEGWEGLPVGPGAPSAYLPVAP